MEAEWPADAQFFHFKTPARSVCFRHEFRATVRAITGLGLVRVTELLQSNVKVSAAFNQHRAACHPDVPYFFGRLKMQVAHVNNL